jgi:hypothetical protein
MQRDQLLWDKKTALYEAIDAALISGELRTSGPLGMEIRASLDESLTATDQLRPAYRLYASPDVRREVTNYRNAIRGLLAGDQSGPANSYAFVHPVHAAMRDDVQGSNKRQVLNRLLAPMRIRLRHPSS